VRRCTLLSLVVAKDHVARDMLRGSMVGQCVGSAWKAVGVVRGIKDAPEGIRDGDKDEDDESLSSPFGQCCLCVFELAAGYRRLVREGGAVARGCAGEQGRSC
jgi:hypothetical protein